MKKSKFKIEKTEEDSVDLPINNIYPLVTAPNLSLFSFEILNQFCIVPYDKSNLKAPINMNELKTNQKDLYLYLQRNMGIINSQSEVSKKMRRGEEFYSLSKIGSYSFAPYIVATKDNGKFCASVINKVYTPWGTKVMPICEKHAVIISQDKTGRFITEDEAHYICGILNTDIIRKYISVNFKSNSISLNKSNLYIPLFNKNIFAHFEISRLSKQIKEDYSLLNNNLELINQQYDIICNNKLNN